MRLEGIFLKFKRLSAALLSILCIIVPKLLHCLDRLDISAASLLVAPSKTN